jgi:crotonobetainyl-CoA:carnitine CoA-transferase CaiB-like acyl-CoA transferase
MPGVLEGIRVLDFGRYIAGPFCATLLGDLGADVIRVERVDGGEDRWLTPIADDGTGATFLQVGRNKRSLTLNPLKPEGKEIVRALVTTADIVVANLPPQTLATMGLDYETLKSIKSDIILTTANAFGSGGPMSNKIGFDGLAQSMSGALHVTGSPDGPMRANVPFVDFGTASLSAFATMAALRHRDMTGEGQVIEGALLKTALTVSNAHLLEQDQLQLDRVASGNRAQTAGPSDVFQTTDGWIMCMIIGAYQFQRWTEMVERPDLLNDDRFKDDLARGDHGEELSAAMSEWCSSRSNEEVLAAMEEAKVPGGPVYSPQESLDDEHINATNILVDVDYPTLDKPARVVDFPVSMSATPGGIQRRPAELGEHTEEILTELGYDTATINELRQQRIV